MSSLKNNFKKYSNRKSQNAHLSLNALESGTDMNSSNPKHIAIIPDGNRRWVSKNKTKLYSGYSLGIRKVIDISLLAKKHGVKILTIWALSTENIKKRNRNELNLLYRLYAVTAKDKEILEILRKNSVKVKIIGNLNILPENLKKALSFLQAKTRHYKDLTINLLVGYGGREDIEYMIKKIRAKLIDNPNASLNSINNYLRTAIVPDVDLIIRTSGEMRLSGFLPWQSSYSELYFSKKYWPDFGEEDLKKAIKTFSERNRRFGK